MIKIHFRLPLSIDQSPAPNVVRITHPASTAKGKFHPGDAGITKLIPYWNCDTKMAPIRIMINPKAANLVKKPRRIAKAPSGSAMERSLVVNNMNEEIPGGALDQKGIL